MLQSPKFFLDAYSKAFSVKGTSLEISDLKRKNESFVRNFIFAVRYIGILG